MSLYDCGTRDPFHNYDRYSPPAPSSIFVGSHRKSIPVGESVYATFFPMSSKDLLRHSSPDVCDDVASTPPRGHKSVDGGTAG